LNVAIDLPFHTDNLDIVIYDINGQQIKQVKIGEQASGKHKFAYDVSQLSKGYYFYQVSTDKENVTDRFLKYD